MNNLFKLLKFFSYLPDLKIVRPLFFIFKNKKITKNKTRNNIKICFQLNYDVFFFLLFGILLHKIKEKSNLLVDTIVCESITAGTGINLKTFINRNPFFIRLKSNQWLRAYGKEIPIKINFRSSTFSSLFFDLRFFYTAYKFWKNLIKKHKKNHSLRYKNIEICDLVIETYLRYRISPRFIAKDFFVFRIIWQAITDIEKLDRYFLKNKPDIYITSYTSYITHGIPSRVAIKHNIKTVSFANLQTIGKILNKNDNLQTHDCRLLKKKFDRLPNKFELLKKSEQKLKARLSGRKDDAIFYMKKTAYHNSKINVSLKKSSVVIYLHDFFDAPHQNRKFIFIDYSDWLLSTIEILNKYKINFYIKQHPNQLKVNDKVIKELRKIIPDHHWLPIEISTTQLINDKIISCGITAKGTIAHELAYFGIHSICCAEHPHNSFNFCRTAKNIKEYEKFLKNYGKKPISKVEMKKQSLAFYYMYNLYGSRDELRCRKKFASLMNSCWFYKNDTNLVQKTKYLIDDLYNDEFFDKLCQNKFLNNK